MSVLTRMLQGIYSVCTYVCHSCVTSGYREGSAAPAFVPNRKQAHKEQGRGGRGEEGEGEGERKGGKGGQRRRIRRRRRTRTEVEE